MKNTLNKKAFALLLTAVIAITPAISNMAYAQEAQSDEIKSDETILETFEESTSLPDMPTEQSEPLAEDGIINEGTCPDGLKWSLTNDGTLTINGSGTMMDYDYIWSSEIEPPWLKFEYNIKNVIISNGITSIGKMAFKNCSRLKEIELPSSISSIGQYAFYNCTNLIKIEIPSNVTAIGSGAFSGCRNLKEITIPSSVKTIESGSFSYCKNLVKITIPSSITEIKEHAFGCCDKLETITIPSSVAVIGSFAFYECTNLQKIILPPSVTSIGSSVFSGCTNLQEIIIPSSITHIPYHAFSRCSNLTNISLPSETRSIGEMAFYGCSSLTNLTIPGKVKEIGNYAFTDCSSLRNVKIMEGVTSLPDAIFSNDTQLEKVSLPSTLTKIGAKAFYNTGLKDAALPAKVTDIAYGAFASCSALENISLKEGLKTLGSGVFLNCEKLKSISIPKSVNTMENCTYGYQGNIEYNMGTETVDLSESGKYSNIKINCYQNSEGYRYAVSNKIAYSFTDCNHKKTTATITKATLKKNGSIVRTCRECKKRISASTIHRPTSMALSATAYTYDGRAKKPTVTVKGSDDKKIPASNFTVSYPSGRKNVGQYTVKITFKGNYSGTLSKMFTIKPKGTSIIKVTAKKKGFSIKWKKQPEQMTGYELQYSTNKKFKGNATTSLSIGKTKQSKTISKLLPNEKYYVRIAAYKKIGSKRNYSKIYSAWSKAKAVTTKK